MAMEKEMSKVVAACEERINAMRADHNIQIQQRKMTLFLIFGLWTDIMKALSRALRT